jgi:DNA-binding MurR/RpiR family transcriptional regulator
MGEKRAKPITERMFKAVKMLVAGGATIEEAAEYMQISKTTVSRVKAAENFDDYRQMLAAMAAEYREREARKQQKTMAAQAPQTVEEPKTESKAQPQVIEHRQTVQVVATHYMMEELKAQTELLKLIASKLTCIIDDLYGTGKGKEG